VIGGDKLGAVVVRLEIAGLGVESMSAIGHGATGTGTGSRAVVQSRPFGAGTRRRLLLHFGLHDRRHGR